MVPVKSYLYEHLVTRNYTCPCYIIGLYEPN